MSTKKMSSSPRTTPGSDFSMKSFVVLGPHRTMMWCQPRRISMPLRMSRAMAFASSSDMPGCTWSAIRWTARRVRALTSNKESRENFSPVPSSSVSIVMVGFSSVVADGCAEQGVVAEVVGGVGRHDDDLDGAVRCTEPVRAVGVEMHRAAGSGKVALPVKREPQFALHHVDPFLATVTGRLRGRTVRVDADLQRLQRRGARKPAAGGDGEAVGLVRPPPGRGGRDGRRAPPLTEQRAHRHPE